MKAPIQRSRHQEPEDGLAPSRDLAVSGAVPSFGETAKHEQKETHKTSETKGLSDKKNPMDPVNRVHRLLELFLKRHSGYKREGLPGWLNLFSFWCNTRGTAMEKAIKFIEMAVRKRRMLRYRTWGSKKKHDEC